VPSALLTQDRRDPEATVLGLRRRREHLVAVEARPLDIVAQHVHERVRLVERSDGGQVERVDVGEVVEHVVELMGRAVDLGRRQLQSREPRDLGDQFGGEAVGHGCRG
jgi:hypothetical protein